MERRAASYTEEEELNQRRRLLNQARKGDLKAINKLFELYQVRLYSGANLKKIRKISYFPPAVKGGGKSSSGKTQAWKKGIPVKASPKSIPKSIPTPKKSKHAPKAAAKKSAKPATVKKPKKKLSAKK